MTVAIGHVDLVYSGGEWNIVLNEESRKGKAVATTENYGSLSRCLGALHRYVDITSELGDTVNNVVTAYRKALMPIKLSRKYSFHEKIQFTYASKSGTTYISRTNKKHGAVSLNMTFSTEHHRSLDGTRTVTLYPGNHAQSAEIILQTEVGEHLTTQERPTVDDLIDALGLTSSELVISMGNAEAARYSKTDD